MGIRVPAALLGLATVVGVALFVTMGRGASSDTLALVGYLLAFFGVSGLVAIAITTRIVPIGEKFGESWNRD